VYGALTAMYRFPDLSVIILGSPYGGKSGSDAPDHSIQQAFIVKTHDHETECDARYLPEDARWSFRVNKINQNGEQGWVTRASKKEQFLLTWLRLALPPKAKPHHPIGLHDIPELSR
jgi:hypothetical protein